MERMQQNLAEQHDPWHNYTSNSENEGASPMEMQQREWENTWNQGSGESDSECTEFKCAICQKMIQGQWGNMAQPIAEGKACDDCNQNIIIPIRIDDMKANIHNEQQKEDERKSLETAERLAIEQVYEEDTMARAQQHNVQTRTLLTALEEERIAKDYEDRAARLNAVNDRLNQEYTKQLDQAMIEHGEGMASSSSNETEQQKIALLQYEERMEELRSKVHHIQNEIDKEKHLLEHHKTKVEVMEIDQKQETTNEEEQESKSWLQCQIEKIDRYPTIHQTNQGKL